MDLESADGRREMAGYAAARPAAAAAARAHAAGAGVLHVRSRLLRRSPAQRTSDAPGLDRS